MCKLQNKEMEKLVYGEIFVEFPLEVLEVLEWIKMAWKYGRERVPKDASAHTCGERWFCTQNL